MKQPSVITRLRFLGYAEAASWVLLLIAMYLKYGVGEPAAVRYTGWIHGALFLFYCLHLLLAKISLRWPLPKMLLGGLCAFLPFGTLWFDRQIAPRKTQAANFKP